MSHNHPTIFIRDGWFQRRLISEKVEIREGWFQRRLNLLEKLWLQQVSYATNAFHLLIHGKNNLQEIPFLKVGQNHNAKEQSSKVDLWRLTDSQGPTANVQRSQRIS